jgi:hypothetical protein
MKSVMRHQFNMAPSVKMPRAAFDLSRGYKTTFNAGYLIPFFFDEVLPGDTFIHNATGFARIGSPLDYPIMDNLFFDTFFFYVPNRLLWNNWQKFMGEQVDPGDSIDFTIPQISYGSGQTVGSLVDYFGLPIDTGGSVLVNSLFFRAYNLIWNEWFRDENLQDSVVVDKDDGPDAMSDYVLLKRGKRHDYFTSCLPWPQKGDSVTIPLGTSAPVTGIGVLNQNFAQSEPNPYMTDGTGAGYMIAAQFIDGVSGDNAAYIEEDPDNTGFPNIRADLSNAIAPTVNQLRESFQIQKILERDARGGTRYTEILQSHFGVVSPDSRLQRPEFLGGGSAPINVTPIAQTSESGTTKQGELAAIGTMTAHGHGYTKSFVEHGVILGLACVRADLTYQQGIQRHWSRETRYDFFWPETAHLGEQSVLNKEIYFQETSADDDVFGYQERFAEYRYGMSLVTGQFRSTASTPLDAWHLSQEFASLPTLGDTFIKETPPMSRVKAVTTVPDFYMDVFHKVKSIRPVPAYGIPGWLDHF